MPVDFQSFTYSITSSIRHSKYSHIRFSTSIDTYSFFANLASVLGDIPNTFIKSIFCMLRWTSNRKSGLYEKLIFCTPVIYSKNIIKYKKSIDIYNISIDKDYSSI